jgi:hypothetical protein
VTLVNATAVTAGSYTADALAPPLLRYLAQLRRQVAHGQLPTSGGAYVTSKPTSIGERVVAPLRITGTVGGHKVDAVLSGSLVVHVSGPVRLTVTPTIPAQVLDAPTAGLTGRQLLQRAAHTSLTIARIRQFHTFLGNPDPTGPNRTVYTFRSATPPKPSVVAVVQAPQRDWRTTIAVAAGLLLATAGALVAWSRS